MAMTNAEGNGLGKFFETFIRYQIWKQSVSTSGIQADRQEEKRVFPPTLISKRNIPLTTRDRLLVISAFFGFTKIQLAKIMGVTRQSIYLWYNGTEPDTSDRQQRIQYLAQIAANIEPEPEFPLFHVYVEQPIQGHAKSLVDYLSEVELNKNAILSLTKIIYEMTIDRRERLKSIPKAKYGDDPSIMEYNLDSFENERT